MTELTKQFRYLNIFLACVQNMTLGGIFFGWASISGTLLVSSTEDGGPGLSPEYVHMMFVIASFFNFLGPLILGIILDLYGPRICSVISIAFIATGCGIFGLSSQSEFPLFVPGMCLIAFGGPGTQNAIIHLSNLFPDWKATATAFITGSFQLSFIVFLLFDQLWLFLNLSYSTLFLGYCIVCVINIMISIFLWPDKPYSFESQKRSIPTQNKSQLIPPKQTGSIRLPSVLMHTTSTTGIESNNKLSGKATNKYPFYSKLSTNTNANHHEEEESILHGKQYYEDMEVGYNLKDESLYNQIFSKEFGYLTIYFLINAFWVNFYIGSFDMQLRDLQVFSIDEQHNYARLFTLIITSGVVFIPIVGALMDLQGYPITSFITIIFGILWSISLLIPTSTSLILSFIFYSYYRTSFFTFFFAYLADTLGFKYFGMLAGIIFLFGGFIGMLQYPLAKYAEGTCHMNDNNDLCETGNWFQVNLLMTLMIASTLYFSYHDYFRRIKLNRIHNVNNDITTVGYGTL